MLLLFLLVIVGTLPARAQQSAAPKAAVADSGQAAGRASWDENYLYFAFQIDDPDLIGTNTAPFSRPAEDDSVAVYLQTGDARPGAPDARTHAITVSVAGGFTLVRGAADGKWITRTLSDIIGMVPGQSPTAQRNVLKYAVTLQGTLNRADDRDQRYTVEMAIPWTVIDAKPEQGMALGYNVVVRARGAGFTSLSPEVKREADIVVPSRWSKLTLGAIANASSSAAAVTAPRIVDATRPPIIDGVLRAAEWSERAVVAFASPEQAAARPAPVVPVAPTTGTATINPLPVGAPLAVERLIMARYKLRYQGNARKLTPFRGIRTPGGSFLLSDQPAEGAGPWFSSDRPEWHRSNFSEMRRAGIDVALVQIGGPAADDRRADEKALLVMTSALRELRTLGMPAPQAALWLDTSDLVAAGAPKLDLSQTEGRAALYQAVRRWFQLVPPEVRATVQLPASSGSLRAYPIVLSSADGFTALDGGFVEDLRRRFAEDFGSDATLLVTGGEDFAASGANLAAYLPVNRGGKGSGAISTFIVQPGYDDTAISTRPALLPRRGGTTFRESWEAAIAMGPRWLILDSWNDFSRGTEVAASRQYGTYYMDQTRIRTIEFNGLQPRDVKWLDHDTPRRIPSGQAVAVNVQLQNAGTTVLRAEEGTALSYRWMQNGKVVGESPLRVPVTRTVYPTQTANLSVAVAAVREITLTDGAGPAQRIQPLPAGDYILRIDIAQTGEDKRPIWFAENGDMPLDVRVTVTENASEGVEFVSTNTPSLVQAGETYPVWVRVRWRGEKTLPADAASLTWQIQSEDGTKTIETGSVPLSDPLIPGRTTTLRAPLRIADAGGNALPAAFPESQGQPGTYRVRWLLTRTQATETIPGVYSERIAVYPEDFEAHLSVPAKLEAKMEAGAITPVELQVINSGVTTWGKGEMTVGYHWFFPDGVEAVWKSGLAATIDQEVLPGKSVKVTVPVQAPDRDGAYVLAFDVTRGTDNWLSVSAITRRGDLGTANIRVTGGRLKFVDLTPFYSVDAVAAEGAASDGDMDGKGRAFPAESFPPDRFGLATTGAQTDKDGKSDKVRWEDEPAYPSGYYADVTPSARRISFRYGGQSAGAKNAVACTEQTVRVARGNYTGLHLAAAATGGQDLPLTVVLRYKDGTTESVTRSVSDWMKAPTEQEAIAISAGRRRTPEGDQASTVALRHIIYPVAVARELEAVTLPNEPGIKVFAMTLEQ